MPVYRVQNKVSQIVFDCERIDDAIGKLDKEIGEFNEAVKLEELDVLWEDSKKHMK